MNSVPPEQEATLLGAKDLRGFIRGRAEQLKVTSQTIAQQMGTTTTQLFKTPYQNKSLERLTNLARALKLHTPEAITHMCTLAGCEQHSAEIITNRLTATPSTALIP